MRGGVSGRRRSVVAVLTMVLLSGCGFGSDADEVSTILRADILRHVPALGIEQVSDWRRLDRPSAELRESFEGAGAVYRVIEADVDRAALAVWQTRSIGAQPFEEERSATGIGCVALERRPGSIISAVIDCPSDRVEAQPRSSDTSWGRDSEALSNAEAISTASIDAEVRWLMTRDAGGVPRTTPSTLDQIVASAHSAWLSDGQSFTLDNVRQQGRKVTGMVTAHASGLDPVDTRRTVRATACAELAVDLDERHPNFLFTTVPCPGSSPASS